MFNNNDLNIQNKLKTPFSDRANIEVIIRVTLEMVLQIFLNHCFCQLPRRHAKITSRPKILPPISPLQMRNS